MSSYPLDSSADMWYASGCNGLEQDGFSPPPCQSPASTLSMSTSQAQGYPLFYNESSQNNYWSSVDAQNSPTMLWSTSPTSYSTSYMSLSSYAPPTSPTMIGPDITRSPSLTNTNILSTNGLDLPSCGRHQCVLWTEDGAMCACGSRFTGAKPKNIKSNFIRHVNQQTAKITCKICGKVFNREDNVRQHIRARHDKKDPQRR